MEFWFCEKCGVRVAEAELAKGALRNADTGVVYCAKCSPAKPALRATPAAGNVPPAQATSARIVPARGVSARTRETTILRNTPGKRETSTVARPERTQTPAHPPDAMKKNLPLFIGLGGGVVLIAGVALFSMTGSTPHDKVSDATRTSDSVGTASSAARSDVPPRSSAAPDRPAPAPATVTSAPNDAARAETAAQDAYTDLERKVKALSDLSSQYDAIDAYLEKHGKTIASSRARALRTKLKDELQPKTSSPQKTPEDPNAIVARAQELMAKQDFAGVVSVYDKAIESDSHAFQFYQNRANAKLMLGDFDGVMADTDKSLGIQADFGAYAMRAIAAFAVKRDDDYRTNLEKAATMGKTSAVELAQRLAVDCQRMRWVAEGKAFETKTPSTGLEYILRGHLLLVRGKVAEATADLKEGVKREPSLGPKGIYSELIDLARAQKNFKDVMAYFKQWADSKPETAIGLNAYAWELLTCADEAQRDPKTALPLAEKAAELTQKNDAAILDTLGLAYFANGRVKEAIAAEKKAIELLPATVTAQARQEYEKHLSDFQAGDNEH